MNIHTLSAVVLALLAHSLVAIELPDSSSFAEFEIGEIYTDGNRIVHEDQVRAVADWEGDHLIVAGHLTAALLTGWEDENEVEQPATIYILSGGMVEASILGSDVTVYVATGGGYHFNIANGTIHHNVDFEGIPSAPVDPEFIQIAANAEAIPATQTVLAGGSWVVSSGQSISITSAAKAVVYVRKGGSISFGSVDDSIIYIEEGATAIYGSYTDSYIFEDVTFDEAEKTAWYYFNHYPWVYSPQDGWIYFYPIENQAVMVWVHDQQRWVRLQHDGEILNRPLN